MWPLECLNCNRVSKYLRFVRRNLSRFFSFFWPICLISLFFYYFHQGEKLQTIKNMVLLAFKVPNNTCKIINFLLRKSGMTYIIYPSMCTANLHNCIWWWWFHDRAKIPHCELPIYWSIASWGLYFSGRYPLWTEIRESIKTEPPFWSITCNIIRT